QATLLDRASIVCASTSTRADVVVTRARSPGALNILVRSHSCGDSFHSIRGKLSIPPVTARHHVSWFPAHGHGPLAQLAEQQTLNLRVLGSIPRRLTNLRFVAARRLRSICTTNQPSATPCS